MTKLTQTSWLGGQMDVRMTGRQDMRNYRNGASVLKNFVPVKLGSVRKRSGTDFVADLTDWVGGREFRMVPFGFLSGDGYVLVLCPDATGDRARAYKADGTFIPVTGDVPYETDELGQIGYVQCGDILFLAHQGHPPAEIRHDLDGDAHSFAFSDIVFNPNQTQPTVGTVSMTRQYFEDFSFTPEDQKLLDTYVSHATNDDTWHAGNAWYDRYHEIYDSPDRRKSSGKTTVNYRASVIVDGGEGPLSDVKSLEFTSPWTESQVVKIPVTVTIPEGTKEWEIRLYKENGGIYGVIGTFRGSSAGEQSHTFVDDNIVPDTSETPIDTTGGTPFAEAGDWPGSVGLYQQRLVWAGTRNDPARIWMSRAGDFYEYRPHVKLRTDDAIDFILPITQFASINFIVELGRLFAFAECTELVIGSASDSAGVSYETIMATEHSHLGCSKRLPPIVANNTLLFVNRTGQSVRDYDERIGSSRFGGVDVSVFASGIFAENPIVDWTWQQEPNSTVWCALNDGRLASFTYDKEQEIGAWAVHEFGGGGRALGIAKTCAVFGRDAAHPTTGEVVVAVERGAESEEDGARRITLERMRPWGAKNDELAENSLCMDCVRETLQHEIDDDGFSAWASDPGRIPLDEYRLPDGRMAILFYRSEDDSEWIVYVGYTFESVMTTMPPVIGDQGGASQFDVKLGQHAHLRTVGSQGGEIYAVGMRNQPSKIDEEAVRDGEDGAEFRDVDVVLAGSNNRDGRVTVRHDEPWPFQLALLELDYEVES